MQTAVTKYTQNTLEYTGGLFALAQEKRSNLMLRSTAVNRNADTATTK